MEAPAVHTRAKRVIVLDTETTGVQRFDRIVTLGAIRLEGSEVGRAMHLVFDPRKNSHPEAYAVHGWSDWDTRFQDLFANWALRIFEWLSWADEIIAHNAAFDMHYVQREFRKAEVGQLKQPVICTMEGARSRWRGQSAKLDDCLSRIGIRRIGQSSRLLDMLKAAKQWPVPTNVRPIPPCPQGDLPRRSMKKPLK